MWSKVKASIYIYVYSPIIFMLKSTSHGTFHMVSVALKCGYKIQLRYTSAIMAPLQRYNSASYVCEDECVAYVSAAVEVEYDVYVTAVSSTSS
jgi:hypothetical protein